MPLPIGKAGGGLGAIILLVLYLVFGGLPGGGGGGFGVDPGTGQLGQAPTPTEGQLQEPPKDDPGKFVDFVAGDVDTTWKKIFAESGKTYEQPIVVLYDDQVSTACGNAP
jgi:predicted metalloprotease